MARTARVVVRGYPHHVMQQDLIGGGSVLVRRLSHNASYSPQMGFRDEHILRAPDPFTLLFTAVLRALTRMALT